jgi:uncharacterized membrane protein
MKKALLLGCATISYMTHQKGIDSFTQTHHSVGGAPLIGALHEGDWEVTHIVSQDIAAEMPTTADDLSTYDLVIISDIGSNTFLLSPTTTAALVDVDRLAMIADYVAHGGGLLLIGGYFAYSGVNATARYGATALAPILPIKILDIDDRVEAPTGVRGELTDVNGGHPIVNSLPDGDWPAVLGYNRTVLRDGREAIATINGDPLLVAAEHGKGRVVTYMSDFSPHWATAEFVSWAGYGPLWRGMADWAGESPALDG